MIAFENDYSEGAHPLILEALIASNLEQMPGYGGDRYCNSAKEKIKAACNCSSASVHLLSGGTQTNAVVLDSILEPYEGVISATTGHIAAHEAGAIEFTGHKVICVEGHDGKIVLPALCEYLKNFHADPTKYHMVQPGAVYISYSTEYGTIYSKKELEELYRICRKYDLKLFVDGARLGYGLTCDECDLTLSELADLCDVFYIGGTKVGALCGEAVVFTHDEPRCFFTRVKQHGALLAKGRLLGIQFDTLFTNDLYFELGRHANLMATRLKGILADKGYKFFINSPTNQIFVVIDNEKLNKLSEHARVSVWEKYDDTHTVIRFATSWATTKENINDLEQYL